MSTFAGIWRFDDSRPDFKFVERAVQLISPRSPNGTGSCEQEGVSLVYGAFCTSGDSRKEAQPFRSASGTIFAWDGRLDDRADLLSHFSDLLPHESSDVSIVAAAYERWGYAAFDKLIGDWVVAVWDSHHRVLTLAKDAIGPRHLYWHQSAQHVLWSTSLEILKALDRCPQCLNE